LDIPNNPLGLPNNLPCCFALNNPSFHGIPDSRDTLLSFFLGPGFGRLKFLHRSGFKTFNKVKDQGGASGTTDSPTVPATVSIAVPAIAGILDIFEAYPQRAVGHASQYAQCGIRSIYIPLTFPVARHGKYARFAGPKTCVTPQA